MQSLILDANIVSALLKHDVRALDKLYAALTTGAYVMMSAVSHYEVRRGLLHRGMQRSLDALDRLTATLAWVEVTRGDWEEAATLWAMAQRKGRPRSDADILLAAQANRRDATVITDNIKHFHDTAQRYENWLK